MIQDLPYYSIRISYFCKASSFFLILFLMESNKKPENSEMTFLELLSVISSGMKKGCQGLLNAFLKFIRFIYKNVVLIFSFTILFIVLGITLHYVMPEKYSAVGTLSIHGSPANLVKEILAKEKSHFEKDGITKINPYYYVDIKKDGIPDYVYFKYDKKLASDTNAQIMNDCLFLEIDFLNIESSNTTEEKIANVLNNNPLLIKNFDFYQHSIQEDLDACIKEIHRLDSLSNKTYFENSYADIQVSGGVLSLGRTTIQLFHEDIFKLQERKTELANKIRELESPVNFPAGITIDQKSVRGMKNFIVVFALAGFFVGVFVALFYKNRKRISTFMNS